jgi:uncharacterized protein YyaL (SSP411 family)
VRDTAMVKGQHGKSFLVRNSTAFPLSEGLGACAYPSSTGSAIGPKAIRRTSGLRINFCMKYMKERCLMLAAMVAAIVMVFRSQPSSVALAAEQVQQQTITWRGFSPQVFAEAKASNRFVILDLRAVWCHWCHVMDHVTYRDPRVVELINASYIAVYADEDANPELANRYGDWGWPATIVFGPDGSEIVKRQGFIPPTQMASMLAAIVADPSPGPSVDAPLKVSPPASFTLSPAQRATLLSRREEIYDTKYGGWGEIHKFIDSEDLEYAIARGLAGDTAEKARAELTLDNALRLLDPVWGGFYQYSVSRDWRSPHYEKIMQVQADAIRAYALAASAWSDKPAYLEAARKTAEYLNHWLMSPQGCFYASQDADVSQQFLGEQFYALDDAARRAQPALPRVDDHCYASANGWAIRALAALYAATGEQTYLRQAERSALWVMANRALAHGGFRHEASDQGGPFLADTLAMGRAFVALYAATGERAWLARAQHAARFIEHNFASSAAAGFITAAPSGQTPAGESPFVPYVDINENIELARFANLLSHYTADVRDRAIAERAMRYAAAPQIIATRYFLTGLLLADDELASEPVHLTVVGAKDDPAALKLYLAALAYPAVYKETEWWDQREGPLPDSQVNYPPSDKAAAFVCARNTCSLPLHQPEKLRSAVDSLLRAAPRRAG